MKEHRTSVCLEIIFAILAIPSRCLSLPSLLKSWLAKKSRIVSPSRTSQPNRSAAAIAMVVLPAPDRPVNQTTLPIGYPSSSRATDGPYLTTTGQSLKAKIRFHGQHVQCSQTNILLLGQSPAPLHTSTGGDW